VLKQNWGKPGGPTVATSFSLFTDELEGFMRQRVPDSGG
jgi:hypothetical protein